MSKSKLLQVVLYFEIQRTHLLSASVVLLCFFCFLKNTFVFLRNTFETCFQKEALSCGDLSFCLFCTNICFYPHVALPCQPKAEGEVGINSSNFLDAALGCPALQSLRTGTWVDCLQEKPRVIGLCACCCHIASAMALVLTWQLSQAVLRQSRSADLPWVLWLTSLIVIDWSLIKSTADCLTS